MEYENAYVAAKLRRWEKYLRDYRLPFWDEIPNFGLYMEQVLALLKEYLDYLPPELREEEFITPATINNYVRSKYMPAPVKKKYYRIHIAYLIMICTIKQSLSIATLQKMVPTDAVEEIVKEKYNRYVQRHRITADYFIDIVKTMTGPILEHENVMQEIAVNKTEDLIIQSAFLGGLSRLFAEKLLLLEPPKEE